jgi:hypothetical protein
MVEFAGVNSPPIVSLNRAVLEIPFVNVAGPINPAGAPTAGYGRLWSDALGIGKPGSRSGGGT